MEQKFITPYGTQIKLEGNKEEVDNVLKKALTRNMIIFQIIKLENDLARI